MTDKENGDKENSLNNPVFFRPRSGLSAQQNKTYNVAMEWARKRDIKLAQTMRHIRDSGEHALKTERRRQRSVERRQHRHKHPMWLRKVI
jgi:hypothetical protein